MGRRDEREEREEREEIGRGNPRDRRDETYVFIFFHMWHGGEGYFLFKNWLL